MADNTKGKPVRVLALLPNAYDNEMTLQCARLIAKSLRGRIRIILHAAGRQNINPRNEPEIESVKAAEGSDYFKIIEETLKDCEESKNTVVIGWTFNKSLLQGILNLIIEAGLPTIVVNWPADRTVNGILFPTDGGVHTVPQFWVVNKLAKSFKLPLRILRICSPEDTEDEIEKKKSEAELPFRMFGEKGGAVETLTSTDVVKGIKVTADKMDLIVLGGPNYGRALRYFNDSIPDLVMRSGQHPSLMLLAGKPKELSIDKVFWEETICLNVKLTYWKDVLACLVDTLIEQKQIPEGWRDYIIQEVLIREEKCSTAVGNDTAFPHIAIPGFTGLAGCFGICPNGIDFGENSNERVRLVFLLISSDDNYQEYLMLLSELSSRMLNSDLQKKLLASRTPREAQMILSSGGQNE